MTLNVVSTTERPDLVPTVAGWVWEVLWRSHGHTLEQTAEAVAATVTARDLPQTYVLLLDDWPVGTATLAARDMEECPDLTPWLAGVFVAPDMTNITTGVGAPTMTFMERLRPLAL